ncbi:MAG: four helix bundle protein [Bacteroidetes bacterium]|nr:four helix bundle protein [Rhodothermaceae bacterium RA]RMH67155.1 MAG: four helix bundle protein [Bacteroidota bacterium]
MSGDEIWDEERWEAFLQAHDRRVSRYMDLFHDFMAKYPPPPSGDRPARRSWENAFRAFLRRKGLHPEDPAVSFVFTERDDADPDADAEPDPEATLAEAVAHDPTDDDDDLDALRRLPVYRQAYDLTIDVLRWSDRLPGELKVRDSALVQFCSCLTQIPGHLARGHALGYEREWIGGNIACVKRALHAANEALALLQEMRQQPYLRNEATYLPLYERTFELRNALGLYVQDLRRRADLGID